MSHNGRVGALQAQLLKLRYEQPLGAESAPLVEALLYDLTKAKALQDELAADAECRANSLATMEQHTLRTSKENAQLVRENNEY